MRLSILIGGAMLLAALSLGFPPSRAPLRVISGTVAAGGCTLVTNAISVTLLQQTNTTAAGASYATPPFTPTEGQVLIAVSAFTPVGTEIITNTGTQLTWTRQSATNYNTLASPASRLVVYSSSVVPGSPGSMTVVLTNGSGTGANIHVLGITGAETNTGVNPIVQTSAVASNATANPQISIAAPSATGSNALLLAFADDVNSAADNAAGNGQTEILETAYNTPATGLATYYLTNAQSSQTLHTNIATSRDWASIALEILAGTNCAAAGGGGTPSFINFTNSGLVTAQTVQVTNTFQSGDLYVVYVKWEDADKTPTVSDDGGNTYTSIVKTNNSGAIFGQMWYAKNVAAGSAIKTTVDMGVSANSVKAGAWLIRGASTSAPLDVFNIGGAASGSAVTTGNYTTSQATEVLVCGISNFGGLTTTPQGSWTETGEDLNGVEWQTRTVTSTGTYQGAGTLSGSDAWVAISAAFK